MNKLKRPDKILQNRKFTKRQHFSLRINLFFFIIFVLFAILIVRLAMLQFVQADSFRKMESRSEVMSFPIAPIRGNIYDKNGYPIAYSTSFQSLYYRTGPLKRKEKDKVVALAKKLAIIFSKYKEKNTPDITADEVIKRMDVGYDLNQQPTKGPSYISVPRLIKRNLSQSEIAYISAHQNELSGLQITEESVRNYDENHIAVQLVGYLRPYNNIENLNLKYLNDYYDKQINKTQYLTNEEVGYDGLEFMYQKELRGKNGEESYPVNALQQITGPIKFTPPVKGNNIFLTLQKNVQMEAQKAITDHLQFLHSKKANGVYNDYYKKHNPVSGYAVAIEVDTGRVVAMASMPDYDPNVWRGGISNEIYQQILNKYTNGTIRSRYADLPDYGKHPTSMVQPGSSIKPLSVLLGLNEGLFTPTEKYNDHGYVVFGKDHTKVTNYNSEVLGKIDAAQALVHSSNDFMMEMVGLRLYNKFIQTRMQIWDTYMKEFGLGILTGSDLPRESEGIRFYTDETQSEQSRLVFSAFGQGARYTTLQMAQYAATLANHGKRMKPLFVDKIVDDQGNTLKIIKPEVLSKVTFPDAYWNVLKDGMKSNVHGFDGFPYDFARKTGTSQTKVGGKTVDNAVFIAYAPLDHPKLAVAVVVPEGGLGSYGAAPIARKIFDAYDKYVGLTGKPNPHVKM